MPGFPLQTACNIFLHQRSHKKNPKLSGLANVWGTQLLPWFSECQVNEKQGGTYCRLPRLIFFPTGWQDVYKPQCQNELYHGAVLKDKRLPLSSTLLFDLQPTLISPHPSYPLIFHQQPLSSSSSCSSSPVLHCASLTQNCDASFSFFGAVSLFSPQIHCPQSCWWLSCLHGKSHFPAQKKR